MNDVPFPPPPQRELEAIGRREGLTKFGLRLTWTVSVIEHLAAVGFDARYGARPLQRVIERQVVGPLSHWLLANPGISNRTLSLERSGDGHILCTSPAIASHSKEKQQ
jgi:ATP-dependent Clp protease ATP-binding subunit ClpC